jgi:hypothetical protein
MLEQRTLHPKSHLFIPFQGITRPLYFHIHVFVRDLYIPRIGPHIWLQQNRQTYPGNIKISHRYMSVGIGRQNILILFCCSVLFLGIHNWEPDWILTGPSFAVHTVCRLKRCFVKY